MQQFSKAPFPEQQRRRPEKLISGVPTVASGYGSNWASTDINAVRYVRSRLLAFTFGQLTIYGGADLENVHVRLYKSAMTSRLIRELGDELWATLCVLALHIDVDSKCYPTQSRKAVLWELGEAKYCLIILLENIKIVAEE